MSAIDSQRFAALGQEWTVRFDFNSICEIEESTGEKFMVTAAPFLGLIDMDHIGDDAKMAEVASMIDLANLRLLLFYTLQEAHPDIEKRTAGSIVQAIGLPKAMEVVAVAIMKALPQQEAMPGGTANPPKPKSRSRKGAKAG